MADPRPDSVLYPDGPFRVEMQDDGTLALLGGPVVEPKCALCPDPVRWVLDMASFVRLPDEHVFRLAHASCAWTPEGFDAPRRAAAARKADTQ